MNTTGGLSGALFRDPGQALFQAATTRVIRVLLLSLATALAVAACGQRGPLYLPPPEPATEGAPGAAAAETEDRDEENEENRDETTAGT